MNTSIVNPRLIDYFNLSFTQDEVDFIIPHLKEDLPLYLDPFLLWSSEVATYRELHDQLLGFFDKVRLLVFSGRDLEAIELLLRCQEPRELGLGYALGSKRGVSLGPQLVRNIVEMFKQIPQLSENNLNHFEVLQLLVPGVAEDRISDITAAILKGFLLRFSQERTQRYDIPTRSFTIANVYDSDRKIWLPGMKIDLPYNPFDGTPLILAPLDWLRHLPWINYADYYRSYYMPYVLPPDLARANTRQVQKERVLAYNRANYVSVQRYIYSKERQADQCKPDPLFEPFKLDTLRRKFTALKATPTGLEDNNDKKYEMLVYDLLASLLYPEFKFAQSQVRTVSGVHIRDLIFYNDGKSVFTQDLRTRLQARQIVFELKNVKSLEREHVNQLYRYLDEEMGHFGILMTRNPAPKSIVNNTIDLHSSKRCIILCLNDSDLDLMLRLHESGRSAIEAIKKTYVEFTRLLPK